MRLGIMDVPRESATAIANVRLAEELGFSWAGLIDSQSLHRELYVTAALCAQATSRILIGPTVTNPVTRHPAVTAAAMATLDEVANGRAILGMGPGDSAVLNLGERPARLADLRAYVETVRALVAGHEIEYRGKLIHTRWAKRAVPIYLTAGGPKTLEMAGEIADGVIIHLGLQPEILRGAVDRIHAGAVRAGRDPAAVELWALGVVRVSDDVAASIDEVKSSLAAVTHLVFGSTFEGKHVPPELAPAIRRVLEGYEPAAHLQPGGQNTALLEDPVLLRYLAERFAVIGPPEVCVERLRAIAAAGIDNVIVGGVGRDPTRVLRALGEQVLPQMA
jgi:5,10-methylenetetrahydromethanopterin reductase